MWLYTLVRPGLAFHPSAPLYRPDSAPQWLLSPRFRSWTRRETRVFTSGLLNNIPLPSPNSRTTILGATTLRLFASRNSSPTILISSLPLLPLPNVIPTVIATPRLRLHTHVTPLCSPPLSHCYTTRIHTSRHRRAVLTSKTRSMA